MVKIDISEFDIILTDPISVDILRKVKTKWNGQWVGDVAKNRNAFGLISNYFDKNKEALSTCPNSIKCYTMGRKIKYINREDIKKNIHEINRWKVVVPKAVGKNKDFPPHQVFIIESGAVCTETYGIIDSFEYKNDAEKLINYLRTDFVRFLLGLRKITQHIPKDTWNWVPYMPLTGAWQDAKLYGYFGITPEEQLHIKARVC